MKQNIDELMGLEKRDASQRVIKAVNIKLFLQLQFLANVCSSRGKKKKDKKTTGYQYPTILDLLVLWTTYHGEFISSKKIYTFFHAYPSSIFVHLVTYLSAYLSIYLPTGLSICPFTHLSTYGWVVATVFVLGQYYWVEWKS